MGRILSVLLPVLLLSACQIPSQWLEPGPRQSLTENKLDEETRFRRQYLADDVHQPSAPLTYDPKLGKIPARSVLTAQGLAIQNEQGCIACHPDKSPHARQKLREEGQ